MALTTLQRDICRLIAENRVASGESYVAGGAARSELMRALRISREVDPFHDTEEALAATWEADRRLLEAGGHRLRVVRERPYFVEVEVSGQGEIIKTLPPDQVGKCVVTATGSLFTGRPAELSPALARKEVLFHEGRIRGALPQPPHITLG